MSHTAFNSASRTTIALLVAAVTLLAYQTFAYRRPMAPPAGPTKPAIIATFDLEKTFNALDEKKHADDELLKTARALEDQSKEMAKTLKQAESELEDHVPGGKKHSELLEKLTEETAQYRAYSEFCKAKVDAERARITRRVYQSIKAAVAEMAIENNYAVVFVDDSIAEIPPADIEETTRQISARRMVYTSSEVDITDSLISRMNEAFAKGNGGAGAP